MLKFAFLVNNDCYRQYTYLAAKNAGASVPRIEKLYKLFVIHNAEPLNRYFELPLKSIWFHKVVDESKFEKDDEIVFILYESFHMTYSRKLIRHYKKRYKNTKFYFFFTNPVGKYNFTRLQKIKDLLDGVYSFNKEDVIKYNYNFLETDPFLLPPQNDYEPKTDVFFVGSDKGRLPILVNLFEKLSNLGLVCDFWITDVPEDKQKYSDTIHYNQRISYEEVLQRVAKTRCVLEVLQEGKSYTSIRTLEALQYHKKILTMNASVKERSFYNPLIFHIFHNSDDISIDFIRNKINENLFEKIYFWTFDSFKKFIEEKLYKSNQPF